MMRYLVHFLILLALREGSNTISHTKLSLTFLIQTDHCFHSTTRKAMSHVERREPLMSSWSLLLPAGFSNRGSSIPFKHHKPHLMKSLSGKLQSPRRTWGDSAAKRGATVTSSGHREGTKPAGAETERGTGKRRTEGNTRKLMPVTKPGKGKQEGYLGQ